MQETLRAYPNLSLKAGSVADLVLHQPNPTHDRPTPDERLFGRVQGIRTEAGEFIPCDKVIISTGTFLGGQINIGLQSTPFGRIE